MSGSDRDSADRSPALLSGPPRRGLGVRRLNKVPILAGAGALLLVGGGIAYTVHERTLHHHNAADDRRSEAGQAAILDTAPTGGMVAADQPDRKERGRGREAAVETEPTDNDGATDAPQEDEATKARREAWKVYYSRLAELDKQRYESALQAMQADLTATGPGAGTGGASGGAVQMASAGAMQPPSPGLSEPQAPGDEAGSATAPSGAAYGSGGYGAGGYPAGGGYGGGYGGGRPVLPDTTGSREKQAFISQNGSDGDVRNDTVLSTVRDPISPYLVTAGDVIPCIMQGGATSDTPGEIIGRTTQDIYDSATGGIVTGHRPLIPAHSKVIGRYDSNVSSGQTRLPLIITRIIFPDSSSIDIGAMSAGDQGGYAGLHDQVDHHLWEKFGNAVILAAGAAAVQLSQNNNGQNYNGGYNSQQIIAGSLGQQFGELGQEYARSGLTIPNTITIRPGYNFVIKLTKDLVLRPYVDRRTVGGQIATAGPIMQ